MTEELIKNGNGGRSRFRFNWEIPVPVIIFLVGQAVVGVWVLSAQSLTLGNLVLTVSKAESTAYKKEDAAREREFQNSLQKNLSDKQDELTRRITILEGQGQARMGINPR